MFPGIDTLDCCDAPSPAPRWVLTDGHGDRTAVVACGCGQQWRAHITVEGSTWTRLSFTEAQALVDTQGAPASWVHDPDAGVDMGLYTDPD